MIVPKFVYRSKILIKRNKIISKIRTAERPMAVYDNIYTFLKVFGVGIAQSV